MYEHLVENVPSGQRPDTVNPLGAGGGTVGLFQTFLSFHVTGTRRGVGVPGV